MLSLQTKNFSILKANSLGGAAQEAVDQLLKEGESQNTLASYRSALRYWAAWHSMRYGKNIELPRLQCCVLQFIVDRVERMTATGLASELPVEIDLALVNAGYKGKPGPLAYSTLVHRIAVLSKVHQLHGVINPCQDLVVRELISRTRKAYAKRGVMPKKQDALTKDSLQLILSTCNDTLCGKRDRALLLFAWSSGGRRRSEVASADMKFLKRVPHGFTYSLMYSKTNQAGVSRPENEKPLLGAAAEALNAWLESSGIVEGRIFRRVLKSGQIGASLAAGSVRDIVKFRCELAGMTGEFSAHSLRSGFVTEAGRQNMPLAETMAMTGHHSVATVMGYSRSGSTLVSRAARLYDNDDVE